MERAGLPFCGVFLDWEKAFDKVDQQAMLELLETYGMPGELLGFIKALLS